MNTYSVKNNSFNDIYYSLFKCFTYFLKMNRNYTYYVFNINRFRAFFIV